MPTDTKLNNLIINYLTQAQYDAIASPNENELYLTPDNSTGGGGGASVSPILVLTNMQDGALRTSITEEEKTNLEKGLYNSVLYIDSSLGMAGFYVGYFPETAVTLDGSFIFSTYNLSVDQNTNAITILGSSVYGLSIGEKSSDGTYPITVEKQVDATFGGGSTGPSLPEITADSVGKFLTVTSEQKTAWGSIESGTSYPIELQLDGSKQDLGIGQYNGKPGIYILSSPNNGIICEWKFDIGSEVITEQYDRILLYGVANVGNATSPNSITVSGEAYVFKSATPRDVYYMGSGTRTLVQTTGSNYKIELANAGITIGIDSNGGIAGAIPTYDLLGAGKTQPSQLPRILSAQYCALRYDFKKTSSSTDTEKVTSSFFGRIIADSTVNPTTITLIGIFDNGMGKAVLEKNASGVFESKTPIEYVEDVNAITYSKARYKHTVTLKTSAGAIIWTQTLSNSKNTPVASYQDLHTLFGEATYAGYGEYAQLNLHGGTEATDKLIKADGTEATLESLGAIVYTDVCFLPK